MKKIIAVVGTIGSGKSTAAKIIAEKIGAEVYKLSQVIYAEADKLGLVRTDRKILQKVGDNLRLEGGYGVLARRFIEDVYAKNPEKRYVIESIRNYHELEELKTKFGEELQIISVDAPLEVRYKRVVERQGQYKEQEMNFEEFQKINDLDLYGTGDENSQTVAKCLAMAEVSIDNSDGAEELEAQINKVLDSNGILTYT